MATTSGYVNMEQDNHQGQHSSSSEFEEINASSSSQQPPIIQQSQNQPQYNQIPIPSTQIPMQTCLASNSAQFTSQLSNQMHPTNPLNTSNSYYGNSIGAASIPISGAYGMPIRGSNKAPKTFKGHYSAVESFINHMERLFAQHQILQIVRK
ncbi:hypothetical protein CPB84DRAFT_1845541 [Gymnopilus junonius]|uniref:Uncharacterized protein n=1 Tax=Gymnopilus junonius TaxID=109634 RepID=A0A9P5NTC7_GYMJU|nr:hypothetical protein CPB84DRAFT_1845541 [Gymnopilus junonius]